MGSLVITALVQHVFVLSIIFWILTWGAERLVTKRAHPAKAQFYECGFKSISDLNLQVNLSFSLVCAFLILYDVEFTFIFPALVNYHLIDSTTLLVLVIFLAFILAALIYDLGHAALVTTV